MLSILPERAHPLKTIGIVIFAAAAFLAISLLALNLGLIIWSRFGFTAFEVFITTYCAILIAVIIKL